MNQRVAMIVTILSKMTILLNKNRVKLLDLYEVFRRCFSKIGKSGKEVHKLSGMIYIDRVLQIYQRAQRIPGIVVIGHVDRDLSYADGAFDADGDVIGIIGDPYRHLFPAFEHGPLDQ